MALTTKEMRIRIKIRIRIRKSRTNPEPAPGFMDWLDGGWRLPLI
jgi:hypothetical protein